MFTTNHLELAAPSKHRKKRDTSSNQHTPHHAAGSRLQGAGCGLPQEAALPPGSGAPAWGRAQVKRQVTRTQPVTHRSCPGLQRRMSPGVFQGGCGGFDSRRKPEHNIPRHTRCFSPRVAAAPSASSRRRWPFFLNIQICGARPCDAEERVAGLTASSSR
ncbi:unnamed protein product [Pleuronectes platessa]|uniref:Uncharacterized protein n=1 Tax=Pleuronectes platessa TaxID=8262 RepID=A0A9N7Y6V1_PLEPL|nr:unnamed protein product [Pleuronectes platessa]